MTRTVSTCFALGLLLAAALAPAAAGAAAPELPEASFVRMLTHTPYAGPTAHTAPVGVDPLQLALVLPLRDGQGAAVAQAKPAAATGCPNARAPQR